MTTDKSIEYFWSRWTVAAVFMIIASAAPAMAVLRALGGDGQS